MAWSLNGTSYSKYRSESDRNLSSTSVRQHYNIQEKCTAVQEKYDVYQRYRAVWSCTTGNRKNKMELFLVYFCSGHSWCTSPVISLIILYVNCYVGSTNTMFFSVYNSCVHERRLSCWWLLAVRCGVEASHQHSHSNIGLSSNIWKARD